jgi:hypothetical protein
MQLIAAGLWPLQPTPKYIEDVFSTYLYSGNSSTQTITNGIDLSTNGGLVWVKGRNETFYHRLASSPGPTLPNYLASNATDAASSGNGTISAFTTTGFTVSAGGGGTNTSGYNYASWTFRKQAKFFDVVTYTGNQTAGRTVAHNLGSVPGFIVCKRTDTPEEWFCYHTSLGPSKQILLNSTSIGGTNNNQWSNTAPTSSVFSLGTDSGANGTGGTYIAYLFANNAGGFGLTESDNVITCGSFTLNGSGNATVTLGYEPQWIMIKNTSSTEDWYINDTMRGLPIPAANKYLSPNTVAVEGSGGALAPSSTGFSLTGLSPSATYIYVAIRRGPMRVPTVGTSVFLPALASSSGVYTVTTNFPVDSCWYGNRTNNDKWYDFDRLRGNPYLNLNTTIAEVASTGAFDSNVNFRFTGFTGDGSGYINYAFQRAPGYMDVVCYTGTGANTNFTHNLGVVPEMLITKRRSNTGPWVVYTATTGNTDYLQLYTTDAVQTNTDYYNSTTPTASVFTLGSSTSTNATAQTFVAYLFATCPGVSKVGTYTGTGAAQTINCGFTTGARFVMIKRTDSAGDWYVWDSARGIIPSNDPYLLINSTAAEVTGTDYVDTTSVGFDITSTAPSAINASGGTFIFLAIA